MYQKYYGIHNCSNCSYISSYDGCNLDLTRFKVKVCNYMCEGKDIYYRARENPIQNPEIHCCKNFKLCQNKYY